jgi:hypothetical protein
VRSFSDTFSVHRVDARQDSKSLAEYSALLASTIASPFGQNIFWPTHADLYDRNSSLLLARVREPDGSEGRAVAGLHVVIDGEPSIHLQGAVTAPDFKRSGAMRRLVEEGIISSFEKLGESVPFRCEVRVFPDGKPNHPARALFMSFGMREGDVERIKISNTHLDRHLIASSEPDGYFRILKLVGDDTTYMMARHHRAQRLSTPVPGA